MPKQKLYAKCAMIEKINNLSKYFFKLCVCVYPSTTINHMIGAATRPIK